MQLKPFRSLATLALALAIPATVLADNSGSATLAAGQSFSFDSGKNVSSGDISFNGSSLTFQGSATGVYLFVLSSTDYGAINATEIGVLKSLGKATPIPLGQLTVNAVFAVLTNAGNVGKAQITASSSSSISFQFATYGATGGGGGGPTITSVVNNSSTIPAGFSNSGISQGALFQVVGTGLADDGDAALHDSSAQGGLPTLLNNAKITVTVNGTAVTPALYYATPTQIDAVMPAATPTGSGTLTVTHNGAASAAFTILVVAAAPGITTYQNGTAVAQDFARPNDPYGGLITFLKSGVPGGIITIWGSGFGATSDDDVKYTGNPHATSVSYTIYIGGVQVTSIAYVGRSVYPGVTIFVLTIPQNVPTGCYVPIAAVSNVNGVSTVSNIATLPIHAGGGSCSDPQFGITGDQLSALSGSFKSGFLIVNQSTAPGTGVSNNAIGVFQQTAGVSGPGGGGLASIGGCILTQITTGGPAPTSTGLNAGTITVTGPGGSQVTLAAIQQSPGTYFGALASIPSTGGAYVFNATAGSQVGAFTATVNFPNPLLVWTNQDAAATITRSQGLSVTWTGGASGSYVIIMGTSTSGTASGSFTCYVPQSAGQFTVPAYVLLGLPAGTGSATVQNSTNLTTFSASGLDFAAALGNLSFQVNATYN